MLKQAVTIVTAGLLAQCRFALSASCRTRCPHHIEMAGKFHVRWVPCHHGMARPQVADGGDGLQIWRVAANILNKQSQTADKGWSSILGLRVGLTTPHLKK
jgi:hypothetical protein